MKLLTLDPILPFLKASQRLRLSQCCRAFRQRILGRDWEIRSMMDYISDIRFGDVVMMGQSTRNSCGPISWHMALARRDMIFDIESRRAKTPLAPPGRPGVIGLHHLQLPRVHSHILVLRVLIPHVTYKALDTHQRTIATNKEWCCLHLRWWEQTCLAVADEPALRSVDAAWGLLSEALLNYTLVETDNAQLTAGLAVIELLRQNPKLRDWCLQNPVSVELWAAGHCVDGLPKLEDVMTHVTQGVCDLTREELFDWSTVMRDGDCSSVVDEETLRRSCKEWARAGFEKEIRSLVEAMGFAGLQHDSQNMALVRFSWYGMMPYFTLTGRTICDFSFIQLLRPDGGSFG
eukprot:Blabericola_migrator_1__7693@NODE_3927_length_1423_cov_6_640855_g2429_i0_p1_GENE_NODE_3927_length_1423_cov_6_640855_g2429_i0NODE_3927_length_1423_cov_6_640855_g2429_i0_p1_ORF_typecomplete_len347_score63_44DUF4996/PF16387_5/0_14_NODE_3927_length_1423_cov_6_640855_g2429_i02031243